MGVDTYCAREFALLHRLESLGDRVADFDAAFFEFLSSSPKPRVLFYARGELGKNICKVRRRRLHDEETERTLARSYAALAFLIASESWNLSTSPWSCFTFSCSSLFFRSSSLSTSTNVWKGDFGSSSLRRAEEWKEDMAPATGR